MIQSQELRIGNWVNTKEFHIEPFKGYHKYEASWYNYVSMFEPIPLTPEILEKAGFKKVDCKSYSTGTEVVYQIYLLKELTYNCMHNQWWVNNSILTSQLKHLHQLQNLYWCLCGEELEIEF